MISALLPLPNETFMPTLAGIKPLASTVLILPLGVSAIHGDADKFWIRSKFWSSWLRTTFASGMLSLSMYNDDLGNIGMFLNPNFKMAAGLNFHAQLGFIQVYSDCVKSTKVSSPQIGQMTSESLMVAIIFCHPCSINRLFLFFKVS